VKNPFFVPGGVDSEYGECLSDDAVRVLATEVRLYSIAADGSKHLCSGLASSPPGPTTPSGICYGPQPLYQIEVADQRELTSHAFVTISGRTLPLAQSTLDGEAEWKVWRTQKFYVGHRPTDGDASALVLDITSGTVACAYNPSWEWFWSRFGIGTDTKAVDLEVGEAVESTINDMEAAGWRPSNAANDGDFGDAVHARATAKLTGPHWLHNAWVRLSDNVIVQIGGTNPSGYNGNEVQQVDSIRLAPGVTKSVDDALVDGDIIRIYEVKSRVRNDRSSMAQIERLTAIAHGRDPMLPQGSRLYKVAGGWQDNPSFARMKKLMAIAGGVTTGVAVAGALYAFVQSDKLVKEFESRIGPILITIEGARGDLDRRLSIIEGLQEIKGFISQFLLDGAPADVVMLGTILVVLGKDDE
jgi:hypothetical protein